MLASWRRIFNQTLTEIARMIMRLVTKITLKIKELGRIRELIQSPNSEAAQSRKDNNFIAYCPLKINNTIRKDS